MQKLLYLFLGILMINCGSVKKKTTYSKSKDYSQTRKISVEATNSDTGPVLEKTTRKNSKKTNAVADNIINTALTFSGTRYKYGGTTKKGMDCSGLLYVSFAEHEVKIPRVSYHMAEEGKNVKIKNVEKGDLLFFKTRKRARRINHVGMVVAVEGDEIKFIHASSSRGVIVSSLREGYWNHAFVKATRVL